MLQAYADNFRRYVSALVLPVVFLAVMFTVPTGALAADNRLITAAYFGKTADVELLLANGVDVNQRLNKTDATALMMASFVGHVTIVELLLASGAEIDLRNYQGYTALFNAAKYGHVEIVRVLLAKGANTDLRDIMDETADRRAANSTIKNMIRAAREGAASVTLPGSSYQP